MALYSMRQIGRAYRMVKWDDLFNVEAIYTLMPRGNHFACECFQAKRYTCKHREMLPVFLEAEAVNTGRFYDYEERRWHAAIQI